MFYEMRRKDRLLTEKEAKEILSEGEYGVYPQWEKTAIPTAFP